MSGETKVKLTTIFSIIGAVGALLAIGGYLFSFGERMGRMEQSITRLESTTKTLTGEVGTAKDKASADVSELAKASRTRLREHEAHMSRLSEAIVALTAEVRVRDRAGTFSPRVPARAQETAAASKVDSKLKAVKLRPASSDPLAGLSF